MDDETQEILNDFLTETTEMIDGLDQKFVELETQPDNKDLLNEIFRAMHSMKGSAGFLGFTHLVDITHRAESILNKLRQGEMAVVPEIITVILETVDTVKVIMTEIRTSGTDVKIPVETMSQKLDDILAGKVGQPAACAERPCGTDRGRRTGTREGRSAATSPIGGNSRQRGARDQGTGVRRAHGPIQTAGAEASLGRIAGGRQSHLRKSLGSGASETRKGPQGGRRRDHPCRNPSSRFRDESRRRIGARPQSPDQNRREYWNKPMSLTRKSVRWVKRSPSSIW